VRCRLHGGIYRALGNDVCKDLAFFIVFNGHDASMINLYLGQKEAADETAA
jgi:hypothetical protein